MSKTFRLKVITPNSIVLDEDVEQIIAKSVDGDIGILPDHIPLITPLSPSPLQYWMSGERKVGVVLGGMMEVAKEEVTIISDHAALVEDLDVVIAEKDKQLAEAQLAQKKDKVDIQKAELELTRALAMLNAIELAKKLKNVRNG